jgi:serine/threonine protein kinase
MDKAIIFNKRCVDTVMNELKLMTELMHPFISNLKYAFQEERTLYLVTEYYSGGDLAYYLYK